MADQDSQDSQESYWGVRLVGAVVIVVVFCMLCCLNPESSNNVADNQEKSQMAEQERLNAKAIQSQQYDTLGLRFSSEDNVQQCSLADTLKFKIPAAWKEGTNAATYTTENLLLYDTNDHKAYNANDYKGFVQTCRVRDVCLYCTSDKEVIDAIEKQFDSVAIDRERIESGAVGDARWYRFPASFTKVAESSEANVYFNGLAEVILSGHDAYYLQTLCYAREYTREIHEDMLRILNSVDGTLKKPVLLSKRNDKVAEKDTALSFLQGFDQFEPFSVRGMNAQTIEIPRAFDEPLVPTECLFDIDFEGTGPLKVFTAASSLTLQNQALVDTQGPYHGTITNMDTGVDLLTNDQLAIDANGDWEVTFYPIANTPHATQGATYTDDKLLYLDEASIGSLSFTHSGNGKFVVYATGNKGRTKLVDATGDFSGSVEWGDPHTLLAVHASDEWSINWK